MTRKDYINIAAKLRLQWLEIKDSAFEVEEGACFGNTIDLLCEVFKEDNPKFSQEQFEKAIFHGDLL